MGMIVSRQVCRLPDPRGASPKVFRGDPFLVVPHWTGYRPGAFFCAPDSVAALCASAADFEKGHPDLEIALAGNLPLEPLQRGACELPDPPAAVSNAVQ